MLLKTVTWSLSHESVNQACMSIAMLAGGHVWFGGGGGERNRKSQMGRGERNMGSWWGVNIIILFP